MHSLTGILPQRGRGEGLTVAPAHLPGGQSATSVVGALQQGTPLLAAHRRACSHTTGSPRWIWKEKFAISNALGLLDYRSGMMRHVVSRWCPGIIPL